MQSKSVSQVPLRGDLNDVDTGIFPAIWNILKNAFVEAFNKELENTVGFSSDMDEVED